MGVTARSWRMTEGSAYSRNALLDVILSLVAWLQKPVGERRASPML
jgi:hypothetical protein